MSVESAPLALAILIAVLGGVLSFLSPCVLPLAPGYLAYLTGTLVGGGAPPPRRALALHALAFVLGFSIIFTVAGIALGAFITSLQHWLDYIRWVGGAVVVLLGLATIGLIRLPWITRQARIDPEGRLPRGRLGSSFLLGVFFAAGWTPCIGVVLSGIFALAATQGARAGLLFFAYALGLGFPFVLTALLFGSIKPLLRRMNRHARIISVGSGLLLVGIGVLLLTNGFDRLAAYAPLFEPPFEG